MVCLPIFMKYPTKLPSNGSRDIIERVTLGSWPSFQSKDSTRAWWMEVLQCGGGERLTVHFMGSGLPTVLFNSSEYTLPELPGQQNRPLTFPLRKACLRIKSRYWDNPGLLECIMYDQIPPVLFSPCASPLACHSASGGINTSPTREISFLIFGRLHGDIQT